MKKTLIVIIGLLLLSNLKAQEISLRFVSYNVENLFDYQHDTLKQDEEFTPEGAKHWNYNRFETKIWHLSQVLVNIAEWQTPVCIGLCEVENAYCLDRLVGYGALRNMGYQYIHQESPDVRGIDCALLYDPQQFHVEHYEFLPVQIDERPSRDHIYAAGHICVPNKRGKYIERQELTHIFVCHFPSQRGGKEQTISRREVAKTVLMQKVDSILQVDSAAEIIVMGDFNQDAAEFLLPLRNIMIPLTHDNQAVKGTYNYKGEWSCLDQFFVSPALLEQVKAEIFAPEWLMEEDKNSLSKRPFRTYFGYKYHGGYSDHLPIYLNWRVGE